MSSKPSPSPSPVPSSPPEAWEPLVEFARVAGRPLEAFLRIEAASGILLFVAAAVALAWANSPWADGYLHFWHTPVGIRIGDWSFERSLEWIVNDGLMVIFFFVVGMEIRREVHHGELSDWSRAALPAAAAVGGMVAPAALYLAVAGAPETRSGWGVPMATDIAFAVGILTLLGKRVPAALRVLLLALAVIDDLGAIVIIALFYSTDLAGSGILIAAFGLGGIFLLQSLGVRAKLAYVPPAVLGWAGIYAAGIHPTIAGVIVGLVTPARAWLGPEGFADEVRKELPRIEQSVPDAADPHELNTSLSNVDAARREAVSPAQSLIHMLHPTVAFGIMPVFALANAGVPLSGLVPDTPSISVLVAITIGLVAGKPIGIVFASWLTLRLGLGTLPAGITLAHLLVLGVVAGVGFTMALFIANLAFTDARLLSAAKLGVLAGSAVAAILGVILGRLLLQPVSATGVAQTADEAESSTEV